MYGEAAYLKRMERGLRELWWAGAGGGRRRGRLGLLRCGILWLLGRRRGRLSERKREGEQRGREEQESQAHDEDLCVRESLGLDGVVTSEDLAYGGLFGGGLLEVFGGDGGISFLFEKDPLHREAARGEGKVNDAGKGGLSLEAIVFDGESGFFDPIEEDALDMLCLGVDPEALLVGVALEVESEAIFFVFPAAFFGGQEGRIAEEGSDKLFKREGGGEVLIQEGGELVGVAV